ncbi:MAG: sulfate reduction electron transfer complex DsrMKJOP subunit DsrJ [Desulfovibrionaceae bacterium]|nr:sulfate reduction electron transfer complex DsrMKJOP subunit DsrJ [Desulfovibrionaceae bacterium]
MLYNKSAVYIGIVILVILLTSPFWVGLFGHNYTSTGITTPKDQATCIENADFMRAQHMRLLNEWRDKALRDETRTYVATDGKKWEISLQNTCMRCHTNYKSFCEKCHLSNSVSPYCWTCHIIPTEGK